MAHFNHIIIEEEYNVTGRGLIFVVDLQRNELSDEKWIKSIPFNKGDTFIHENKLYKINGVEAFKNLFDGKTNSRIGLQVKLLSDETIKGFDN